MPAERAAQYLAVLVSLAAVLTVTVLSSGAKPPTLSATPGDSGVAASGYGKLPLAFEPNSGRTDRRVDFVARGAGHTLFLTPRGATFSLSGTKEIPGAAVRMRLVSATPVAGAVGEKPLAGTVNSFVGNDPSRWKSGIKTYGEVRYPGVYPGIDILWHGHQGKLEYDFAIAPGANPGRIAMRFQGQDSLRIGPSGELVISSGSREMRQPAPVAYQRIGGREVRVNSGFRLDGDVVRFELRHYERSSPLVIDPSVLVYSTFLGGTNQDTVRDMTIDSAGNAYVLGETSSVNFPTTPGAFEPDDLPVQDVFVTKLSPSGTSQVFSTYLGGDGFDDGFGIDVHPSTGEVAVAGQTSSTDFPTTAGAFQTTDPDAVSPVDAFVSRLNPSGSALSYSTYLGPTAQAGEAVGEAVDFDIPGGGILVAGYTTSATFPAAGAEPAFDPTFNGVIDGFVTRLLPLGGGAADLDYSTYLGGGADDVAQDVRVDPSGNAIVVGNAASNATQFPTTPGSFDTSHGGNSDGFISKLDTHTGGAAGLLYSGFHGGSGTDDFLSEVAVDGFGRAYVAGRTDSADLPTTAGAFDTSLSGLNEAYLAVINASGGARLYSTYFGGSNQDFGIGLDVDPNGNAYLVGLTESSDLPVRNAYDPADNPTTEAYVAKLRPLGTGNADLVASTYLGAGADDIAVAVKALASNVYVAGFTNSVGFPTTAGAFDTSYAGGPFDDGTVTRFISPGPPTVSATNPASPADENSPSVRGTAASGTTVRVYRAPTQADCTAGNLAATGSAAQFGSTGLTVSVLDNTTTTFRATATDTGGTASVCSASAVTYAELTPSPPASAPDATFAGGIEVTPVSGTVLVKVPGGSFVPLESLKVIPPGSIVDTKNGFVKITAEQCDGIEETAIFWDGIFKVSQGGAVGCLLEAKLVEKLNCRGKGANTKKAAVSGPTARVSARSRRLWGSGSGRFRTRGRGGSASLRGTTWLTRDRCDSTLFKVTEGVGIVVTDRDAKPSKIRLGPGDKYTAR